MHTPTQADASLEDKADGHVGRVSCLGGNSHEGGEGTETALQIKPILDRKRSQFEPAWAALEAFEARNEYDDPVQVCPLLPPLVRVLPLLLQTQQLLLRQLLQPWLRQLRHLLLR